MMICPQCQKVSQSDKICDHCWHDFKAKPRKKTTRDLTKMPIKDLMVLTAVVFAFCIFLMIVGKVMSPSGDNQNNISINNSK
jgi:hypothetical protein